MSVKACGLDTETTREIMNLLCLINLLIVMKRLAGGGVVLYIQ